MLNCPCCRPRPCTNRFIYGFPYAVFIAFSCLTFSTPAVLCHILMRCIFMSHIFSVPVLGIYLVTLIIHHFAFYLILSLLLRQLTAIHCLLFNFHHQIFLFIIIYYIFPETPNIFQHIFTDFSQYLEIGFRSRFRRKSVIDVTVF